MFKFIEFLRKRPKDKTIRISRVIFGIIILIFLGMYFGEYELNIPTSIKKFELHIKYFLFILGIVPLIMGTFDPCFAKRKYVKIIQILFGIALITIGNMINIKGEAEKEKAISDSKGVNIQEITDKKQEGKKINIGFWIAMLGILPLIGGISGKCISQKCFKHGEIITKIRV